MTHTPPAGVRRDPSDRVADGLNGAARDVANNPWVERGERAGLAARGVVFLVLAYLIARIALGALGEGGTRKSASGEGVVKAIAEQSGGKVALVLLGVGLLLYALFSLIDAVRGHNTESSDVKRWGKRGRSLWRCGLYAVFGVYCFVTSASSSSSGGSSSQSNEEQQQWSAEVLRWPAGWLWLGLLGVALVAVAAYQVFRAVKRSFREDLKRHEMSRRTWQVATVVGVIGHLGRAGAFALVGWFVLHAAFENDPKKGKGVDGSARMLAESTGGPYLLWLLAIGVAFFGLYMFVESRYRKV